MRILSPLRDRRFRLLWAGLAVSLTGDGVFLVAVAWQAYALRNSPAALAGAGLASVLAQLVFTLPGGALSDRVSRRTVLVLSDAARGGALLMLAAAGWSGHLQLWHLWAAAGVVGAGAAFASPAYDAIVPELVPPGRLQQANGLDQVLRPLTLRLAGPALGGVLVMLARAPGAFLADACSFAVSAACFTRIRSRPGSPAPPTAAAHRTLWRDMVDGLRFVRGRTWLWGTFTAASLTYLLFLGPTEVLLPYVVRNQMHAGPGILGLVLGAGGAGALGGAALVGRREHQPRPVTFMYTCWAGATLCVAGYGLAQRGWQLAAAATALNLLEAAGAVAWSTLKQRLVPGDLLGRVSSIDWFVSTSLMPLSFVLTPLAAQALGVRATFIGAGMIGAATTLAFLLLPGMREPDCAAPAPAVPLPDPEGAASA